MTRCLVTAVAVVLYAVLACVPLAEAASPKPDGEMRWALYVTLAPQWFDPGETQGQLTPFWVLYAIHDALVKPMPGGLNTPSLAESWSASKDGLTYEFVLRKGAKFHNGDPVTAEDVKFSFQRYKGSRAFKDKVREITIVDPYRGASTSTSPSPTSWPSRARRRRRRAGWCPSGTSRRSATTASRSSRSGWGHTSS